MPYKTKEEKEKGIPSKHSEVLRFPGGKTRLRPMILFALQTASTNSVWKTITFWKNMERDDEERIRRKNARFACNDVHWKTLKDTVGCESICRCLFGVLFIKGSLLRSHSCAGIWFALFFSPSVLYLENKKSIIIFFLFLFLLVLSASFLENILIEWKKYENYCSLLLPDILSGGGGLGRGIVCVHSLNTARGSDKALQLSGIWGAIDYAG